MQILREWRASRVVVAAGCAMLGACAGAAPAARPVLRPDVASARCFASSAGWAQFGDTFERRGTRSWLVLLPADSAGASVPAGRARFVGYMVEASWGGEMARYRAAQEAAWTVRGDTTRLEWANIAAARTLHLLEDAAGLRGTGSVDMIDEGGFDGRWEIRARRVPCETVPIA